MIRSNLFLCRSKVEFSELENVVEGAPVSFQIMMGKQSLYPQLLLWLSLSRSTHCERRIRELV